MTLLGRTLGIGWDCHCDAFMAGTSFVNEIGYLYGVRGPPKSPRTMASSPIIYPT
jgi:hypothetical protein